MRCAEPLFATPFPAIPRRNQWLERDAKTPLSWSAFPAAAIPRSFWGSSAVRSPANRPMRTGPPHTQRKPYHTGCSCRAGAVWGSLRKNSLSPVGPCARTAGPRCFRSARISNELLLEPAAAVFEDCRSLAIFLSRNFRGWPLGDVPGYLKYSTFWRTKFCRV